MVARRRKTSSTESAADEGPERTCAVTRAKLDPAELIRFVVNPEGAIVPDLSCKLPGRGVWVRGDADTVGEAARSNAFARSLKRSVTVPEGLAGQVEALMRRRALEALSLANKAGLLVTGFAKVDTAVGRGDAAALLHAAEASADGSGKLDRKMKAVLGHIAEETGEKLELHIVNQFDSTELSLATGRLNVVHAALTRGGATEKFLREAGRLKRYRLIAPNETAAPSPSGLDTEHA